MVKQNVLSVGLTSQQRPDVIFNLNNGQGSFLFNHNIREVNKSDLGEMSQDSDDYNLESSTVFLYDSLRCEYPKTADNIFSTLLEAKYPQKIESKMWNEFKSAELGLLDESFKEPYIDFLRDRLAIRKMVNDECLNLKIPIEL